MWTRSRSIGRYPAAAPGQSRLRYDADEGGNNDGDLCRRAWCLKRRFVRCDGSDAIEPDCCALQQHC